MQPFRKEWVGRRASDGIKRVPIAHEDCFTGVRFGGFSLISCRAGAAGLNGDNSGNNANQMYDAHSRSPPRRKTKTMTTRSL